MNKNILVIIDNLSYAKTAIKQAKKRAKNYGVTPHFVAFTYEHMHHAHYGLEVPTPDSVQELKVSQLRDELSQLLQNLMADITYTMEVVWHEHPAEWLLEDKHYEPYELVIKARHIDKQSQFSPLDWQLIRFCPLPLYLAADNKWHNNHNVMAALDLGSNKNAKLKLNQAVIEQGQALAKLHQCQFYACYTVHVSPFLRDLGIVFCDEQEFKALEKIPTAQRELLEQYQLSDKVLVKAGLAEQVIPSLAAKYDASLVIMGSVGRKGLKGQLIGNTAEKVLPLLKTDLLILSPEHND